MLKYYPLAPGKGLAGASQLYNEPSILIPLIWADVNSALSILGPVLQGQVCSQH